MRVLNIPPTSYLLPPARCAERSDAPRRAVRSEAPCRAKRCALLPLTLQSYNTGEAKSSILPKQRRAARVFLLACRRSALIVNRLVANGLSSFALAPLVLRLALLLLQCCSVTVPPKAISFPENTSIFIYKYRVYF